VGGPDTVRAGLHALADSTQADELMLVCDVYEPALRLRALDIAAQALQAMPESLRFLGRSVPADARAAA
jgi:hypothetical protein